MELTRAGRGQNIDGKTWEDRPKEWPGRLTACVWAREGRGRENKMWSAPEPARGGMLQAAKDGECRSCEWGGVQVGEWGKLEGSGKYSHKWGLWKWGLIKTGLMDPPSFTAGGKVNWCSRYGKPCGGSSKTRNRVSIWLSNPSSVPENFENTYL